MGRTGSVGYIQVIPPQLGKMVPRPPGGLMDPDRDGEDRQGQWGRGEATPPTIRRMGPGAPGGGHGTKGVQGGGKDIDRELWRGSPLPP